MSKLDDNANDKAVAEFLDKYGILLSERHNIPLEDVKAVIGRVGLKYDFTEISKAPEEEILDAFDNLWSEEKR